MAYGSDRMGMFYNMPIQIEMAGWRSDTHTLQQHGWELSADQRVDMRCIQLALHHPKTGIYALSMVEDLNYFLAEPNRGEMLKHMVIHVNQMGAKLMFQHTTQIEERPMSSFQPVDATPHMVETTVSSLEDLVVFRPLPKEIIVAPDSVPGLMDKILALQDPKMKKLMSNQRKRDARDAPKIESHCQIISIAS